MEFLADASSSDQTRHHPRCANQSGWLQKCRPTLSANCRRSGKNVIFETTSGMQVIRAGFARWPVRGLLNFKVAPQIESTIDPKLLYKHNEEYVTRKPEVRRVPDTVMLGICLADARFSRGWKASPLLPI